MSCGVQDDVAIKDAKGIRKQDPALSLRVHHVLKKSTIDSRSP